MTPRPPFRQGERTQLRQPIRSPFPPSTRPVDRRFQKRPVTTSRRPDRLLGSMTVCIAAVSRTLHRVVTVSDRKIATDTSSVDDAIFKWRQSPVGWHCLFSATHISRFESIWNRIQTHLFAGDLANKITVENMAKVIESAYRAELRAMAEVTVLNPWTMDLPTFEMRGRARLGETLFSELHAKITALDIGVELLAFGFDNGSPQLLQSSTNGIVFNNTMRGYAAIGTGQYVATEFLDDNIDFLNSDDVGYVIYRLCEAKFTSEKAPGVGRNTSVASFAPI